MRNPKPLVPPELLATVPPFYRTEAVEADAKVAVLKIFDPCGRFTLYVVEYEPAERTFFGYVVSPLGPDCDEWGYSSLDELEEVRNRLGLPLELDLHWQPGPIPELQDDEDQVEDVCVECGSIYAKAKGCGCSSKGGR